MRNAQEVIAAIQGARYTGHKVGLQNTRALLDALGLNCRVPAIHVAGTNGKGSVCAMVERVLRQAGYRTGLYTSPFLQAYNERIRLDGAPVSDALLEQYGNQVLDAAEKLHGQGIQPTAFELGTALALLIFQAQQVDLMVIEVGLGGRLDPTNVITPLVSVITAIGLDHMQLLGDTVEQIAGEKAGIIKPGVPVVCHPAVKTVEAVFAHRAAELNAPLTQLRAEQLLHPACDMYGSTAEILWDGEPLSLRVNLPGAHQLTNALTAANAIHALRHAGIRVSGTTVSEGIAATRWPARLEWHENILLDGGHNAQGLGALKTYVDTFLRDKRRVLVTGVLEDHLRPEMLEILGSLGESIVTVTPESPRALNGEQLAGLFCAAGHQAQSVPDLACALSQARASAGEDGVVIVAGSLYLAGAARTELGLPWR